MPTRYLLPANHEQRRSGRPKTRLADDSQQLLELDRFSFAPGTTRQRKAEQPARVAVKLLVPAAACSHQDRTAEIRNPTLRKLTMSNPIYTTSVPVFRQMLTALKGVLAKAQSHAEARKIDPNALLHARLFPDMFMMMKQVQVATDFANSVCSRLANVEIQKLDDADQSFADLQLRIDRTLAILEKLPAANFVDAASRKLVNNPGTPRERVFEGGEAYLLTYGLPHFFFHVTTAFNILRHNGVEIGKRDYLGG